MKPHLVRRGFDLGEVPELNRPEFPAQQTIIDAWHQDTAILLPGLLNNDLPKYAKDIENAQTLMENVLENEEIARFVEAEPYLEALNKNFFIVATSAEEHDKQGIEKLYADAFLPEDDVVEGAVADDDLIVAENLWCKGSWLSFHDGDASLRFRFSWGMEGFEDVAADPVQQDWAGKFCDVIFPESAIITENETILSLLDDILGKNPSFVERIVYFNAPNGGAQMHHDVERGHAGVVFAQLSGSTFWLAISKPKLIDALIGFVANADNQASIAKVLPSKTSQEELRQLCGSRENLSEYMEEPDHELVEAILDRCPAFVQQLSRDGFAHRLETGDVLLLPQRDIDNCVWHAVFTLGDNPGEALSFAVR
ncbi:MAG: hypothetical protein AUK35_01080 [Zetaproteobacteria bacterium CG2_30_46_52]|nr:MAG: hypothetical protein AUK35_01080 [Zetaproteobacteria bacterium CG2_30_46_52]